MGIFKSEIIENDFECYMKFPSFYRISQTYFNKLFNVFTGLNRVENIDLICTPTYREAILKTYYSIKDKFNLRQNDMNGIDMYNTIIRFFEVFIDVAEINIPVYNDNFEADRGSFKQKHLGILKNANKVMDKLFNYFEDSGLALFLTSDDDYSNRYIDKRSFVNMSANDYYVYKEGDIEIANIDVKSLCCFKNDEGVQKLLGQKRRREYCSEDLIVENGVTLSLENAKKDVNHYGKVDFIPVRMTIAYRLSNINN
jgi:hypothetical protein